LPSDLSGLTELQIASLLSLRTPTVDLVAETLGTSRLGLFAGPCNNARTDPSPFRRAMQQCEN